MSDLQDAVATLAAAGGFSGAVRVDTSAGTELDEAFGLADRAHQVPNTTGTRFGIASGVKGFTALVVATLLAQGQLELTTPARSVLGDDLPLIDDDVTIEQLLAHRSGIGDYLDEEAGFDPGDYVLPLPVHRLATTASYLPLLEGRPTAFAPDARFAYCNSGYVILALIAERVSGSSFPDLVRERVCEPAAMRATEFLRSDELPGDAARGYLKPVGLRTNVLHLPVRGSGDGGAYSTTGDLLAFWSALFADRIVPAPWRSQLLTPRSDVPRENQRYGLGFWLHATRNVVALEGFDAGVSFRSVHDPSSGTTHTVVSNTPDGAWPLTRALDDLMGT